MTENNKPDERRRFTRIPFHTTAHVVNAGGSWYGKLIDISLKGVLITLPEEWEGKPGEHFLLELPLDDSTVSIRMEVLVAHCNEHRVGFECAHIDLDSITHLRRLMELNLGDPELLNRELSALD